MLVGQKVLDDGGVCKKEAVPVVGLVVRYSLSHPVWSCTLVDNTHLRCHIRRADVGDNRLLHQTEHLKSALPTGNLAQWRDSICSGMVAVAILEIAAKMTGCSAKSASRIGSTYS